eukprot:367449_1
MSWYKGGNRLTINGAVVTHNDNAGGTYQSTYGMQEISNGKHEWKIKIHKTKWSNITFGISSNTKHLNTYYHNKDGTYALYAGNGNLFTNVEKNVSYANGAAKCVEGDTITVHLDLDKGQMSYSKNGTTYGTAFKHINKNTKYRIAVSTVNARDKFEMISYRNVSTKIPSEVTQWLLNTVQIKQDAAIKYGQMFEENEFQTVNDIKDMITNENELENEIGIKIFAHRRRIWAKMNEEAMESKKTESEEKKYDTPTEKSESDSIISNACVIREDGNNIRQFYLDETWEIVITKNGKTETFQNTKITLNRNLKQVIFHHKNIKEPTILTEKSFTIQIDRENWCIKFLKNDKSAINLKCEDKKAAKFWLHTINPLATK